MRNLPARIVLCVVLAFVLLTSASVVRAQESPNPEPDNATPAAERPWAKGIAEQDRQRALQLFTDGNAFFVKRQYAQALRKYDEAVKSWNHPAIRGNMAVCKLHLDRPLEAYEDLKIALRFGQGPLKDSIYSNLLTLDKALLGQLATLHVHASEPGAQVYLDGTKLFAAPGTSEGVVEAGAHRLVASKPDYLTKTVPLTLLPGKTTKIELKLISLDAAGTFERRWHRWVPWAVVIGGSATALLSIPFQLSATSNAETYERDLRALCPEGCRRDDLPSSLTGLEDRSRWQSTVAVSLLVAGGAIAATGGVLTYLNQPKFIKAKNLEEPRPDRGRPLVLPIAGDGSAGVSISSTF